MRYCDYCALDKALTDRLLHKQISSCELNKKESIKNFFLMKHSIQTYVRSTLAVASSIIINLEFFRIARAKQTSCFWPTLKFEPLFCISESNPCFISLTVCFNCTFYFEQDK